METGYTLSNTVYVALDLEATDMHPERGEIIELGAIKFTDERIVDRWSATVRPRGPVPFAITQLTGITKDEVRRAAPFAAVAPALTAFLRTHPIVGQSVWLDVAMLRAAGLTLANPIYDTFELATLTLPGLPGLQPAPDRRAPRSASCRSSTAPWPMRR